ncbi:hypothetical protein K9M74_01480 [Candidatus Woesearchaeota archaeon]|nr:hypothetical protein [Candidatus Woesearchaeota archaeon]
MNRHEAHHMFVVASIYLLGIIVIIGVFLVPTIKERFARTPELTELYPMLVSNYSAYVFEGRIVWMDKPDITVPIFSGAKYDIHHKYPGDVQTGSFTDYTLGVFAAKKDYFVYRFFHNETRPTLYGPFTFK